MTDREAGRGCGCAVGVLGALVLLVVGGVVRSDASDSRQAQANHRQADQQITTLAASFAQQLDTQAQHSTPSDSDLSSIAQSTMRAQSGITSGLMAQGVQVLEPVTHGTDLTFDIQVIAVYRVPGWFTSGSEDDDRCFRIALPHHTASTPPSTVTALPACPAPTTHHVPTRPRPTSTP
ncbi:hypothetical protein [Streptacidiphilus sp. EB129]|uniref:hypothetical protein n=1 Tax=Streptacidiphilus sp. EB129 TaxID=3156262 RepID=UPI0035120615